MNGYIIILLIFISFVAGFGGGFYLEYERTQAKQLASVEAGVKQAQDNQVKIEKADSQAVKGEQAETAQTVAIIGELHHGKNLTDCKLDSGTIGLLHKASIPITVLP